MASKRLRGGKEQRNNVVVLTGALHGSAGCFEIAPESFRYGADGSVVR